MKVVLDAVDYVLKQDPLLTALVGTDVNQQTKIYRRLAPHDTQAPFITYIRVPGGPPIGKYQDLRFIEQPAIQLSCFGRTSSEAWDLWEAAQSAMELWSKEEWNTLLIPYNLLNILRAGDEQEMVDDADTGWILVPGTYSIRVAR